MLGQLHVSHCAASPLLLITSVNIWNCGEQLLDLWERNVVPFLSDVGFLGLHVFRSGLQQVSPAPSSSLLLRSRAVGIDAGRGLTLSC